MDNILGYTLTENGLYKMIKIKDVEKDVLVSQTFNYIGKGCDDTSNGWGSLIEFKDNDGVSHLYHYKNKCKHQTSFAWAEDLEDKGFRLEADYKKYFVDYMDKAFQASDVRLSFPKKVGWGNKKYILPHSVFPASDNIYPDISEADNLFTEEGSYDEWKKIAEYSVGNHPYAFALMVAYAPLLMEFADIKEGAVFHLGGVSSIGKSMCLRIAASVWGNYRNHISSWNNTQNYLANLAQTRNDNVLFLDELGEAKKDIGDITYMLTNGISRGKNDRNDIQKPTKKWRTIVFSSGEISLNGKLKEFNKNITGGQEVRFIHIPMDLSMYTDCHGFETGKELSQFISQTFSKNYGFAGKMLASYLADNYERYDAEIPERVANKAKELLPKERTSQVERCTNVFALVEVAGEIAQERGLLPESLNVNETVRIMYNAWLSARSAVSQSTEAGNIVKNVYEYITKYSTSKFSDISSGLSDDQVKECVGFKDVEPRYEGSDYASQHFQYYLTKNNLLTIAQSENLDLVLSSLKESDMLLEGKSYKGSHQKKIRGIGTQRFYCVRIPDDLEV